MYHKLPKIRLGGRYSSKPQQQIQQQNQQQNQHQQQQPQQQQQNNASLSNLHNKSTESGSTNNLIRKDTLTTSQPRLFWRTQGTSMTERYEVLFV